MRIAYDAAPLLNPRTGVGHYAACLLEHLLAADPDLAVDCFAVGRQRAPSTARAAILGDGRTTLRRLPLPARAVVRAWAVWGRPAGERLVGTVDAVHGTNFWLPPLRRPNGVLTIHDLTFLLHPEWCTPQVRRYRWIVPRVLSRCAVVLTPSSAVADEVAAGLGFDRDRIVVTPEGVRSGAHPAVPEDSLGGPPYVLFVGTQEPRKNLSRLLRAFARVREPDVRLVLAGPPGWGSEDLVALAVDLGIAGRVEHRGYLPDGELAALVAGARAFAFPSLYEGFGLPPLEAMAAGVPVVAARAGSLPEVLGDAPLWCEPTDVDSIAAALEAAIGDEDRRRVAVAAGLAQAARYDWAETARRTLDAYRVAAIA